jgi:hypothetical protein
MPKSVPWQELGIPPYGHMNAPFMRDVLTREVPERFKDVDGRAPTPSNWNALVESLIDDIASFLWPRFNRVTQEWIGNSVDAAMSLTIADLQLMRKAPLRTLLLAQVEGRGHPRSSVTHLEMFLAEDEVTPGVKYERYDPDLAAEILAKLQDSMHKSLVAFGPAPLRFKQHLQRPRPYQMTFLLDDAFTYQFAKSAVTPSLVSGHCLQAAIAGCSAFAELQTKLSLVHGATELLKKLMVDFGDRRVFAGVHYPSDNISSWYVALRLCDGLFGPISDEIRAFLWDAITKHSKVYAAMKAEVDTDPSSAFRRPLQELQRASSGLPVEVNDEAGMGLNALRALAAAPMESASRVRSEAKVEAALRPARASEAASQSRVKQRVRK